MRIFLSILIALVILNVNAQKPNIGKAKSAYEKKDYTTAKQIIDAAATYEKTKSKAKTWFYRGNIYMTLDTLNDDEKYRKEALDSYAKALELDPKQSSISTVTAVGTIENVDTKLQSYYSYFYNKAVKSYEENEIETASKNFGIAGMIIAGDTASVVNAAHMATQSQNNEAAKKYFKMAKERGANSRLIFNNLYVFLLQEKDYDEALKILKEARKIYPNDIGFQKAEISVYIQQNRVDDAKNSILETLKSDPNNPDLYFSLGVINEQTDNKEEALKNYTKALEIDPDHFNSNYNLAVVRFNDAQNVQKERNALSYKEADKIKKYDKKLEGLYTELLPNWEKLYDLKSDDSTIVETLKHIYMILKKNDAAEKMQEKLETLQK